jgi:hypothetical protein
MFLDGNMAAPPTSTVFSSIMFWANVELNVIAAVSISAIDLSVFIIFDFELFFIC